MKYIRTNEGIYNTSKEYRGKYIHDGIVENVDGIETTNRQADTIEELCDAFVIGNKPLPIIWSKKALEKDIMPKLKYHAEKNCEVYGAIWTDKGLIYVAKMNDKGELELL